ncbi:pentatricopeptide repeat-containing protein At5g66520-like [Phoenix dactylifera]|uniref:Pentatricopeptide repeat-containing protein At5g66520-like n=1 Tax=Phoenix dactylifera TaxID=42345 RepID=A0A8B7CUI0_PHODC|nr:pentatricopeptide repeat-containing protein At5g66520-like [Phoenix dactylifera]
MQSSHIQKPLTIAHLKPLSTLFKSTFASDPNPLPRFIPDHPILPLIESLHAHPHTDPRTLHAHAITSGLIRDPFAASRVIQLLLRPGPAADLRYATAVFNALHRPDVYTWNAMIAGHADRGLPDSAVAFYFCMRASRAPPNTYTFALLVKACIDGGNAGMLIGLGKEVHGQVLKCGVEDIIVVKNSLLNMYCAMGRLAEARLLFDRSRNLDLISWNTLISGYGKNGEMLTARELFERMPERSLVSWSAMIDGCVRNGDFSEALRLFDEMQAERMKPDVVTLVSVLKACAQLGVLDQGCRIHRYIDRSGLVREDNVILETALVDMYCKCGCIDEALKVFDKVRSGDVVSWNAMISGLAMHGHGERALELFGTMKERGIIPNESTFIAALCACTHAGMVEDGKKIFESMREYGVEPHREHYGCLADLLGRAGQVEEAEEVLLSMPMEPQASQWGALMSACRTHDKIEVGERVGKRLISLEPYDGGRYVLMANMYAVNGQWDDAGGMRRVMEEMGAKKETGCSFIE